MRRNGPVAGARGGLALYSGPGSFGGNEGPGRCRLLTRDRDNKLRPEFDAALHQRGILRVRLPRRSPNLNASTESFIQSVQMECLDRFVVMGPRHLDHLVAPYVEHDNLDRPHSGIGHRTPAGRGPPGEAACPAAVVGEARLGGVLRSHVVAQPAAP